MSKDEFYDTLRLLLILALVCGLFTLLDYLTNYGHN